ncbi:hypothetical protein EDD85DRAFT_795959 [Armillaria nabsnona]|nr:hypothetical protein EDD85DRAFT_795959 [Armillaria nabsnona]
MPSNPTMQYQHSVSAFEDLPLELLQKIFSIIDIATLKCLSLASSVLRAAYFPHIFGAVFLYGPFWTFVDYFKGQVPSAMHMLGLAGILEDISPGILPWCAKVHTVRISSGNVRNTVVVPWFERPERPGAISLDVLSSRGLFQATGESLSDAEETVTSWI